MRGQLAAMKTTCWDLITRLRASQQQVAGQVSDQARALFGPQALTQQGLLADPQAYAAAHEDALSQLYHACLLSLGPDGLTGTSQDLWQALRAGTADWGEAGRRGLLARYAGFPIWDALIFPVIYLARLPQLTPITVQRFSPLDATCLKAVDADGTLKAEPTAKLDGVAIHHFGAFFDRSWRENDYLWGRLDGAELVLRLLGGQSGTATDLTGNLRSALTAILAAEQPDLGQISKVTQALAAQVKDIKTMRPNGP